MYEPHVHIPFASLAWIDTAAVQIGDEPANWLRRHAGLELSSGADFGPGYEHFVRLNFATSHGLLSDTTRAMLAALPR